MRANTAAFLSGVLLLAVVEPLAAQRAEFGPRLGIAFSTVSTDADPGTVNSGNVTGFVVGGFVRFRPERLGVLAELLYVRKGASLVTTSTTDDNDMDVQFGYVEIPLLLALPIVAARPASVMLYGGPTFSLEAECRVTLTAITTPETFDCNQQDSELAERRQMDVGATVGAGVRLGLAGGAILADVRYTLGFVNLNEETGNEIRNRSLAVVLGYAIRVGR
jgi:outer membrane protein with beta-barrel domain